MTKWFMIVFGILTIGTGYLTAYDVGVMEPSVKKHSIRQGSVRGAYVGGGYRGGK